MTMPPLNKVTHIPLIAYQKYIDSKYSIPKKTLTRNTGNRDVCYWDLGILDSHMFRGNDSSKNFYNQFMNEGMNARFTGIFSFLKPEIQEIFSDPNLSSKDLNERILKISEQDWITAYIEVIQNTDIILHALGKDHEYWLGYIISGLFESAVMSSYGIDDYHENCFDSYYWHISW